MGVDQHIPSVMKLKHVPVAAPVFNFSPPDFFNFSPPDLLPKTAVLHDTVLQNRGGDWSAVFGFLWA